MVKQGHARPRRGHPECGRPAHDRAIGVGPAVVLAAGLFLVASLVDVLPPRNQTPASVGIEIVNIDGPPVSLSGVGAPRVVLKSGERTTFDVNRARSQSTDYLDIRQVDNGKLYLHYALGTGVVPTTVIVRWPGFAYLGPAGQTRQSSATSRTTT